MSLSHASPEELLPDAPEHQAGALEAQPAAADKPLIRPPFNHRKIIKGGSIVLLTVSLAGSLIALVVMGRQVSDLTIRVNTLDAAFRSGQIGQLASNVSSMEARLKTLEHQTAALASLPAELQSAGDEQASLKNAVSQLQDAGSSNGQVVAQLQTRLSSLEHDVQQSSSALKELNRQLAQKAAEPEKSRTATEAAKTRAATPAKKINRSARRTVTLAAPFVLTGIERRGGQTFAVVIPRGASQISAMRLLSPGDSLLGWTLRSTEGSRTALFTVNGSEQRLHVE
ncbi:kinetochore Spc7 family protein [Pantoea dispersa]|uniref:plasmid transfer protein n=1 Tax=Pantoea dispersa TaxID=59814 RepID=UPI001CA6468C|nr:plasmid transfer protein [Pantoea dispersa]QZY94297.1 plasmid transfer protein [Pantoea dispersa]